MPIIIIFLVVGALLAYISQHNFMLVSLSIGPYFLENLPLFYVIVGSLITGFVLSYIIHLYQSISPFLLLRGTKNELLGLNQKIETLYEKFFSQDTLPLLRKNQIFLINEALQQKKQKGLIL